MVDIASLECGDEIKISSGFGHPKSPYDRTEVVYAVSGNSAITNMGTQLALCHGDYKGVTLTGNRVDNPQPTEEAKRIMREAGMSV